MTKEALWAERKYKRALDAMYNAALENLLADGVNSASWIKDTQIRGAYNEVWSKVSYNNGLSTARIIRGAKYTMLADQWKINTLRYMDVVAGDRITEVVGTSRDMYVKVVNDATKKAASEGLGVEATQRRIRKLTSETLKKDINIWRARRIAQTEVVSAGNYGSHRAIQEMVNDGLPVKQQWVAIAGAKTDRHYGMNVNGQVREIGKMFDVGGEPMAYPGDPQASAANTINCRCNLQPYLEKEDRLGAEIETQPKVKIPKVKTTAVFNPANDWREVMSRVRALGIEPKGVRNLPLETQNTILKTLEKENTHSPLKIKRLDIVRNKRASWNGRWSPSTKQLELNESLLNEVTLPTLTLNTQKIAKYKKFLAAWSTPDGMARRGGGKMRSNIRKAIAKSEDQLKQGYEFKPFSTSGEQGNVQDKWKATLTHEIGHGRGDVIKYKGFDFDPYDWKKLATEYSATNQHEYFAEWYAQFRLYGEKNVPLDLLTIFKKL